MIIIIFFFACYQTATINEDYEYDYGECENENEDVKHILGKN